MSTGTIVQVSGPVVDVEFPDSLPGIYNALKIEDAVRNIHVTLEVAQHLGNDVARCVAMASTDGCRRGMTVVNTGSPIMVVLMSRCDTSTSTRLRSLMRSMSARLARSVCSA